ncbi:MAG: hypothetical protein J5I57_11830 [Melioribacteraceae bacterium]|nr:hypothetical protein [Melioribacteraceae bacterium]
MSFSGCLNPFAPKLDTESGASGLISDRKQIDGVFTNLQYAYSFKDTTIYGEMLNEDFTFTYRDYELGVNVSWGRDEEMKVTYGLFQNSQKLDLIWNDIVAISSDSTNVVRSFNLTITFNPTDIILVDGKVNLSLAKDAEAKWYLVQWIDESNF